MYMYLLSVEAFRGCIFSVLLISWLHRLLGHDHMKNLSSHAVLPWMYHRPAARIHASSPNNLPTRHCPPSTSSINVTARSRIVKKGWDRVRGSSLTITAAFAIRYIAGQNHLRNENDAQGLIFVSSTISYMEASSYQMRDESVTVHRFPRWIGGHRQIQLGTYRVYFT